MPKSIFESDIEKATSEYNVAEDWQIIMDITDKINTTQNGPKDSLKYIMKRINHAVPHVSMQALTLLAACVDNCGKAFHLEICSRDWVGDAKSVITRGHAKVSQKIRELIQKWAEDFKNDAQLHIMVKFYKQLKIDGFSFDPDVASTSKGAVSSGGGAIPKQAKEDELNFKEDLDLAIAMSLQEAEPVKTSSNNASSSIYPTFQSTTDALNIMTPQEREQFQVRALYDFEAAEENEMTFKSGEIFAVLDNSDENWWKGRNQLGVGLFPANFVTTELVEEKPIEKKKVRFADSQEANSVGVTPQIKVAVEKLTINEEHLDVTLSMLQNASPNEIDDEEETICTMEERSSQMAPLIEKKILAAENKKDDLNDLSEKFLQALAMYQQLMQEPRNVPPPLASGAQLPSGYASPQHALQYHQQYATTQSRYGATGYDAMATNQPVVDPAQMVPVYGAQAQTANSRNIYAQQEQYVTHQHSPHASIAGQPETSYQTPQDYSYEYGDPSAAAYAQSQQYSNEQYYGTGTAASYEYQPEYNASPAYSYQATPQQQQTPVYQ